jgi:hypothetical protein
MQMLSPNCHVLSRHVMSCHVMSSYVYDKTVHFMTFVTSARVDDHDESCDRYIYS